MGKNLQEGATWNLTLPAPLNTYISIYSIIDCPNKKTSKKSKLDVVNAMDAEN